MSATEPISDDRRRQILAMAPEDRAALANLIRQARDKIPVEIARLQDEGRRLDQWIAEFAPDPQTDDGY